MACLLLQAIWHLGSAGLRRHAMMLWNKPRCPAEWATHFPHPISPNLHINNELCASSST